MINIFIIVFTYFCILISPYFLKNEELFPYRKSLPPNLQYLILKNASSNLQLKIFKKSKKLGRIIQKFRGNGVDALLIVLEKFHQIPENTIRINFDADYLYSQFTPNYFIQNYIHFPVKEKLKIRGNYDSFLSLRIIKIIASKIIPLNLKSVCFYGYQLDGEILNRFMIPSITKLWIENCNVFDFDAPQNVLTLLPLAKIINVPWQLNVTSMEALINIERKVKFSYCLITNIFHPISPNMLANFGDKHMEIGGILLLTTEYSYNP